MRKRLMKCAVICVCMILTACGRKQVEYNTPFENDANGGGTNEYFSIKETIDAKDVWEEHIDRENSNVKGFDIQAEVNVPDVTGLDVLEYDDVYFDDEATKKEILNTLKPDKIYNHEEEYRTKKSWDEVIAIYERNLEDAIRLNSEDEITYFEEMLAYYNDMRENAPETYTETDDFSIDNYMIEKNGQLFRVEFVGDVEYSYSNFFYAMDEETLKTLFDCPEDYTLSVVSADESNHYKDNDNRCRLSEEEVARMAKDYLEELGFGEYSVVECSDLKVIKDDPNTSVVEDEYFNGAYVILRKTVNGVEINGDMFYGSPPIYVNEEEKERIMSEGSQGGYSTNFWAYVSLNDEGILSVVVYNPIKLRDNVVKDVKILSFQQIQEMYRYYMETVIIDYPNQKDAYKMKEMSLVYQCVNDPNDRQHHSIIPAWRLGTKDNIWIVLNAIDGEFINVYPHRY